MLLGWGFAMGFGFGEFLGWGCVGLGEFGIGRVWGGRGGSWVWVWGCREEEIFEVD